MFSCFGTNLENSSRSLLVLRLRGQIAQILPRYTFSYWRVWLGLHFSKKFKINYSLTYQSNSANTSKIEVKVRPESILVKAAWTLGKLARFLKNLISSFLGLSIILSWYPLYLIITLMAFSQLSFIQRSEIQFARRVLSPTINYLSSIDSCKLDSRVSPIIHLSTKSFCSFFINLISLSLPYYGRRSIKFISSV